MFKPNQVLQGVSNLKKILFVMTNLNSGGIATSLVNLVNVIADNHSYSISVLLFDESGSNIHKLPNNVSIILGNKYTSFLSNSLKYTREKGLAIFLFRVFVTGLTRLIGKKYTYKLIFSTLRQALVYDIAISFSQSSPSNRLYGGCNEFVIEKVTATHKISFLHADYLKYGLHSKYNSILYSKFNKIACVSNSVKKQFIDCNPKLSSNTFVVKNIHDCSKIRTKANDTSLIYNEGYNILTVSRLTSEKGLLRAMNVIKKLHDIKLDFKWHIVGDGPLKSFLREYTYNNSLSDIVVFYGDDQNPYKYMKNANALLVPSFHEAAPMVIEEAIILGLYVVTTNTLSAAEMVSSDDIGNICENNEDGLYNSLKKLITERPKILNLPRYEECETMNANRLIDFKQLIDDNWGDYNAKT